MPNIIFTIIIYPLKQLIELCYFVIIWFFRNQGFAIIGISMAVSVITLPLYFMAESQQNREREAQKRLKSKKDTIKAVFRGDEQYMLLSVLYRQNNYHPIMALRSSLGLLIQIPFFIAAFSFLTNLDQLRGSSFFFIKNLSLPDNCLVIGNITINILPLIMTLVNCLSSAIYSINYSAREKIQLYLIAFVFLVLLYNSPSGMVLYWTMNNLFSLVKNLLQKLKRSKLIINSSLAFLLVFFEIYLIFIHSGKPITRLFIGSVLLLAFIIFTVLNLFSKKLFTAKNIKPIPARYFFLSLSILFIHSGIVIPATLIASSVREFSFIESFTSPFPFFFNTLFQAAGITLFWPVCIYFLLSSRSKHYFSIFSIYLFFACLINTYIIPEKFGFLTTTMFFSEASQYPEYMRMVILNIVLLLLAIAVLYLFIHFNKLKILIISQVILVFSLFSYGIVNILTIKREFTEFSFQYINSKSSSDFISSIYRMSKEGKNIVLLLADNFISGYFPHILNDNPYLENIFTGWTYYPNCVSFANHTLAGTPPIYGGYEYTPLNINKRDKTPLLSKQIESYLLLPVLFWENKYNVTVTDPPFDNYLETNLGIFKDYPEINAENINGKYTSIWLQNYPEITGISISKVLFRNLSYFSLFKCAPLFLRMYLYDNGHWLSVEKNNDESGLTPAAIDDYILMDILPELTKIDNNEVNSFINIYSHLPHTNFLLQYPDYVPRSVVTDLGPSEFANEPFYSVDTACLHLLGKWLRYLKENGIYDNTRIIVVSDHGRGNSRKLNNISLPNGDYLQFYNCVLLYKDFNSEGTLSTENKFMTNADVPLLLLSGTGIDMKNPFTGNTLQEDKNNGATVTTIGALSSRIHSKYQYKINSDQWLHVKDDIFTQSNWSKVDK